MLDRLHTLLLSTPDVTTYLFELAKLATLVADRPLSCGITLQYDTNLTTVGSSDERAELLDETQYRTGQGPCLQAVRTGRPVEVGDARNDSRWPAYLPRALEMGLRCCLSLPLSVTRDGLVARPEPTRPGAGGSIGPGNVDAATVTLGALNVYGFDQPEVFSGLVRRQLELYAMQAAGTLRLATRQMRDATLLTQMEQALSSRSVIDQAIGIIIAGQRCSAASAFDLIRRESQNSRRPVREIAADLVARTSDQPPQTGSSSPT